MQWGKNKQKKYYAHSPIIYIHKTNSKPYGSEAAILHHHRKVHSTNHKLLLMITEKEGFETKVKSVCSISYWIRNALQLQKEVSSIKIIHLLILNKIFQLYTHTNLTRV